MTTANVMLRNAAGSALLVLVAACGRVGLDSSGATPDPWDGVPQRGSPVDHSPFFDQPFADATEVTAACLACHPDAARQVMATGHYTWAGQEVLDPATGEVVKVGKSNLVNNFCIGTQPNQSMCSKCHTGYGWTDAGPPPGDERNVDCLVCHDGSRTYAKADGGWPAEGVDLLAVARSVGTPQRSSCGACHFHGGGGNGVKHGDLDSSLAWPDGLVDVHMGKLGFTCADCYKTADHVVPGCSFGVCTDRAPRVECTDCHAARPHDNTRLDAHTDSVACQTCHIPAMAVEVPTKMEWDWSAAGQDLDISDPHVYMKKKGRFRYEQDVVPEYRWYSRSAGAGRYLTGQPIGDPDAVLALNTLCGEATDPDAQLWPVKVHRGRQPYDKVHGYLLIPKTVGEGGYWTDFDWDQAFRLAEPATGLAYSGEFGFVATEMVWPLSQMVQPASNALQCRDCHGDQGRLDWRALGYQGDPAFENGQLDLTLVQNPQSFRAAEGLDHPAPIRLGFDPSTPKAPVCRTAQEVQ